MKKTTLGLVLICCFAILQNCGSSKNAAAKSATKALLNFDTDVMPIIQASCTPCHFPPDGRKEPLNNKDAITKNIAEMITRVKLKKDDPKFMPFKNKKPPLSDSAILILEQWQKQISLKQ